MSKSSRVRAPAWKSRTGDVTRRSIDVKMFKEKQAATLSLFRKHAACKDWDEINSMHFDWWMFPIDDGRMREFNLKSDEDVRLLVQDNEWLEQYRESIAIVARSMGWCVKQSALVVEDGAIRWDDIPYSNKDVRLAKMIRSTWLMEDHELFDSLQLYARFINKNIYFDDGFWYGDISLDEILYMRLPRNA